MTALWNAQTRAAWIAFLAARGYTHAVTLKPNHKTERASEAFLRRAFNTFHRDVDQNLLGPRFNGPSKRALRTEAVGIIEGLPHAGHIHAMFRVPRNRWAEFEAQFRPLAADITVKPKLLNPWAAKIIGGTSVTKRLTSATGWVSYTTKYFADIDAADRVMFLPLDA